MPGSTGLISKKHILPSRARLEYEVKACVDTENIIAEANENNNCRTMIYGKQFIYNFYLNSHMALWVSNYGTLTWPMVEGSQYGSAFKVEAATMENNMTGGPIVVLPPADIRRLDTGQVR